MTHLEPDWDKIKAQQAETERVISLIITSRTKLLQRLENETGPMELNADERRLLVLALGAVLHNFYPSREG